jgi:hypothetical protein
MEPGEAIHPESSALSGVEHVAGGELLLTGSPREILARILAGDPLELRRRLALRLRERALLLDAERVLLRALAFVAYRAGAWRGRPELARWLQARIDEAIDDALAAGEAPRANEDEDAPAIAPPAQTVRDTPGGRDVFALLATPLGLSAAELRAACARFNRLPACEREAFFLLVIDGESLDSACAERAVSANELARAARRALAVLCAANARRRDSLRAN